MSEEEIMPEDIVIEDNGSIYTVSEVEGNIQLYCGFDLDEADDIILDWMDKEGFYPKIWFINDHGNVEEYDRL